MKVKIGTATANVFVVHVSGRTELKRKFPTIYRQNKELVDRYPNNKMTMAELSFDRKKRTSLTVCHENDGFNRKRGVTTALKKVLSSHPNFESNRTNRTKVYNAFLGEQTVSPYTQLMKAVSGKPDLAMKMVNILTTKGKHVYELDVDIK